MDWSPFGGISDAGVPVVQELNSLRTEATSFEEKVYLGLAFADAGDFGISKTNIYISSC